MMILCFSMQKEDIIKSILLPSVMSSRFCMQEKDNIEHTSVKCHVFTKVYGQLVDCCVKPRRHRPRNSIEHINAKCHDVTLMIKLLVINVT